jgi:hypothetical protein
MSNTSTLIVGTLVLVLCTTTTSAQAPSAPPKPGPQGSACAEQTVRDAIQNHTFKYADDTFFWSGALDKPLIGKAAGEDASKKMGTEGPMRNTVAAEHPQRIVVSNSGDMAYEYGTGEVSFDDRKTGKHTAFQTGYLRVWKSVDGQCEAAASMIRPIEGSLKSK